MRNYLEDYEVLQCASLVQALEEMNRHAVPLAGGTDLMVYLHFDKLPPGKYLDLHSVPELKGEIEISDTQVTFSALTTYMDVRLHPYFREKLPLLREAAALVGAPGIQTIGTWAGNIVNASPAADGVPALMVYDASVVLRSTKGSRTVPLAEFYQGYKKMTRSPEELITHIVIPVPQKSGTEYFRKVGERKAQAITKVLLAGRIERENGVVSQARIIYGSVMPYTYRSKTIENMLLGKKLTAELIGQVVRQVAVELKPIDDVRSTARYRLKVAQNLTEEFLNMALEKE